MRTARRAVMAAAAGVLGLLVAAFALLPASVSAPPAPPSEPPASPRGRRAASAAPRRLVPAGPTPPARFGRRLGPLRGTALTGRGAEHLVRHRGDYTLRKGPRGWRTVAYDVRGRVPGPREARCPLGRFSPGLRGGPLFVLVIGTAARPGWSVERSRADSIHIVGVNPSRGRASIV